MSDSSTGVSDAPIRVESFDTFFRREHRRVVALVYALGGSRAAAEDLAQDAFSTAFRRWDDIADYDDPGAWVRNVAMNNARSLYRRRRAELRALTRLGGHRQLPAELSEPSHEFWREVRRLPAQQAKAVALVYLDGQTVGRAAAVLGCSEGSVKTHLSRARATLATRLEPLR